VARGWHEALGFTEAEKRARRDFDARLPRLAAWHHRHLRRSCAPSAGRASQRAFLGVDGALGEVDREADARLGCMVASW
jgi:hypothetical protein